MAKKHLLVFTDGGSRGNPGPAAAGYVVDGDSHGVYLGVATNNIAEYSAIKHALEESRRKAGEHAWETTVEVRMDSQLAQRQLTGRYKMKNAGLRPIFEEVRQLCKHFKQVTFVHIPREENSAADAAVNKILDEH